MPDNVKVQKIPLNKGFLRYLQSIGWQLTNNVSYMLAGLFVGVLIARYLGPENYGIINFAQGLTALVASLTLVSMRIIVVREIVTNPEVIQRYFFTAFCIITIAAAIVYSIILFTSPFFTDNQTTRLVLALIALGLLTNGANLSTVYFESQVKGQYIAYAGIVALGFSVSLKLLLLYQKADVTYFAAAILFDAAALAIANTVIFIRVSKFNIGSLRFSSQTAKYLLRQTWPLVLSGMLVSFYMKIDQVIIMDIVGPHSVGLYSAALKLSEVWYFVPMTVVTALFPAIINGKRANEHLYYSRMLNLYALVIFCSLTMSVFISFFGNNLIDFLFGETYAGAAAVLKIHIWSSIFVFLGVANGRWLLTEGLQKYTAINTGIGAATNVILNYLLIPKYGIEGAAWATLVSYAFAGYGCLILWPKTRPSFWAINRSLFTNPVRILREIK